MIAEGDTLEEEHIIGTVQMVLKKTMTHKSKPPPSNKRSKRRHEGNIRQALYMEKCWKVRSVKSNLHFSHFNTNAKLTKLPERQSFPGFCIFCPKQYYANKMVNMKWHFKCVHIKRKLQILGKILLLCKCCEVPCQGNDDTSRNTHFHCPMCHKPCENKWAIAVHLISKHDEKYQKLHVFGSKVVYNIYKDLLRVLCY